MKTIIKEARRHGLVLFESSETSFRLVSHRHKKEMRITKLGRLWIASTDNVKVIMPFMSSRAMTFAVMAMYRGDGFFCVGRTGSADRITEAQYTTLTTS